MSREHLVIDVSTGDTIRIPYTVEEEKKADEAIKAGEAELILETAREVNETTIRNKARQALQINATYLGRTSPTAQQRDDQLKALTRQMNALLRLELQDLDDINGT